ncbi:aldehyde dehydrogenase family protein [Aliiruegeria haliotis]|uniref:Aldehyde dehydrogenase family protein n=1 Tax=Aliiruegeria haliotis TaxID=1280846 RepID=A0A2T0RWU4_9RHOB|nr:aldehyde dehydrogenase family protein [Aliiruegeria haliotis]PRY25523.1 aldehyde dehydrogenase family protein [Aliiruegeria haliotis]
MPDLSRAQRHAGAAAMRPGVPLPPTSSMGAIMDGQQTERSIRFADEGQKSANRVASGKQVTVEGKGLFVQPTNFDDVGHDSPLIGDEVFGPDCATTPIDTEAGLIVMTNDSIFGTSCFARTCNLSRALRTAEPLDAGSCHLATVDALLTRTPFGGLTRSGFGREPSMHCSDRPAALKTISVQYRS